jgi:F-type H+-transporting ATPase subunit delta
MASATRAYARAFSDVVFEKHLDAAQAMQELHTVEATMAESADLRRVWENPSIPAEQKRRLLDAIASREGLSQPVRNFIAVLIDHRRIQFLSTIVEQFQREINARMGFVDAQITSARDLTDPEKHTLEGQVENLTGKKVKAQYRLDNAILGGAVVRVGSTIYDGSVLGQLERVREQLIGN